MSVESSRTGGSILVRQLELHGVDHIFCVPGESYLAALNALHDSSIKITVCRQEGGAAMMAEAYGKLTGRPGVCFVTRGPGATNASAGVHIARQDSTPMLLLVGQVERGTREREAFQELDYRASFGPLAKWATEIDTPRRIPEVISRAFHVATSGRPGPVVIALPEDMLVEHSSVQDPERFQVFEPALSHSDLSRLRSLLAESKRPLIVAGGTRWDQESVDRLVHFSERFGLPVSVSFRRQSLFPANHPNYVGDLTVGANPTLVDYAKSTDLLLLFGCRFSELPSQSYSVLSIPKPRQKLVHVHPASDELGRVYRPDLGLCVSPKAFVAAVEDVDVGGQPDRSALLATLRDEYVDWSEKPTAVPGRFNLGAVICQLRETLPPETVVTNGAGNYAIWVHRFYRFERFGTQLAPISGSMGYGVPAGVAAARINPQRPVIVFAGDGCFLMNGQEFATAVQYNLPLVIVVVDNGMYGTIRMHQERDYPDRTVGTSLTNPDFAEYARAFGGHGERVDCTEDFLPAYERARGSGKPSIIHCITDPEALTPTQTLSDIVQAARTRLATAKV